MERVEVFGGHTLVLRTRQVGSERWCCDVFGRESHEEHFLLEEFGDTELEAVAMALSEADHHTHH